MTSMMQESGLNPDCMKVAKLKYWLSLRKLSTKGKKAELVLRYALYLTVIDMSVLLQQGKAKCCSSCAYY